MGEPRTITLTLRATVAAVVVAVLLLGLLAAQLVFITQQRGIVDHQRDIAQRQEERAAPVLNAANALIGSPGGVQEAAAQAGQALSELREVLRTAIRTDAVSVAARALRRAPELLADVNRAVAVLDRTYPTLRTSLAVQRDSRSLTAESLGIQRQILALTTELRDIAAQTLVHVESIDDKTGGTAPAPVLP